MEVSFREQEVAVIRNRMLTFCLPTHNIYELNDPSLHQVCYIEMELPLLCHPLKMCILQSHYLWVVMLRPTVTLLPQYFYGPSRFMKLRPPTTTVHTTSVYIKFELMMMIFPRGRSRDKYVFYACSLWFGDFHKAAVKHSSTTC